MNCQRCNKPCLSETDARYIKIVVNAWQPEKRLCVNCIGWFQTYWNRFMENDLNTNELVQVPSHEIRALLLTRIEILPEPIPMILHCPECAERHIDENGWEIKIHYTHACQNCGLVWRPAIVPTIGVRFLPGFKNEC